MSERIRHRVLLGLSLALFATVCALPASPRPVSAASGSLPTPIVSLGDSYSSGEGNPPFDAGTDQGNDRCHRSAQSWPRLLGATAATHLACSGAKIPDLFQGQVVDRGSVNSVGQIARLQDLVRQGPVGMVTVTLGGNDAGFADTLINCVWRNNVTRCLGKPEKESARVDQVTTQLRTQVYPAIRTAVGPTVPIVVVSYPRLFPKDRSVVRDCAWLDKTEQANINSLQEKFDQSLEAAVSQSGVSNIRFVSVLDTSEGHELCRRQSLFRPISVKDCGTSSDKTNKARCAHPAPPLHRAIAERVRAALGQSTGSGSSAAASGTVTSSSSDLMDGGVGFMCSATARTVECWGPNVAEDLGIATTPTTAAGTDQRLTFTLPEPAKALAAGDYHVCALTTSGTVLCWGRNGSGQLGDGTNVFRPTPNPVLDLSGVTRISAGGGTTCAISNGSVFCWGANFWGSATGGGATFSTTPVTRPTQVLNVGAATAIATGNRHSCAIVGTGTVTCWGYDIDPKFTLSGATAITAGGNFSCAIMTDRAVRCWGRNDFGELGDGTLQYVGQTPRPVVGLNGAEEVVAGEYHACARTTGEQVVCWGRNASAQLGDGTREDRRTPVAMTGISNATGIATSWESTCVASRSKPLVCTNVRGPSGDRSLVAVPPRVS